MKSERSHFHKTTNHGGNDSDALASDGSSSVSRCIKCEAASGSPVDWTVADVVSYFTAAGFPEQAAAFRTQVSQQSLFPPPEKCH